MYRDINISIYILYHICALYIYIHTAHIYDNIYIQIFFIFFFTNIYIYIIYLLYIYIIYLLYIYIYHISIYHHEIMRTCFQSYRHVILPRWKKKQGGLWGTMNDSVNCNGKLQYAHHQKFKNSW